MLKVTFILIFLLTLTIHNCKSHGHSHEDKNHGHSHEQDPAFKYSRSANVHHQEDSHHHEESKPKASNQKLPSQELWINAMASTLIISAVPFLLLFVIPLESTDKEQPLLKILLAFASGGLLGDAFLHLIPHANAGLEDVGSHSHSHSHSHGGDAHGEPHNMSVGLWVLAGIVAFLVVEKGVRIIKGSQGHGHSHGKSKDNNSKKKNGGGKDAKKIENKKEKEPVKDIKVAGYLNLAADFSHNFTDGLAIGSSYLAGNTIGEKLFKKNSNIHQEIIIL